MAVTHTGQGVVWSISSTGFAVNGAALTPATAIIYDSQRRSNATDSMEHKNQNGETFGLTTFNQSSDLSIECYAVGSTLAAARTARDAILPVPGSRVTITDGEDANIAGDWICMSSELGKAQSDKAKISMTLKRFAGISTYTPTPAT